MHGMSFSMANKHHRDHNEQDPLRHPITAGYRQRLARAAAQPPTCIPPITPRLRLFCFHQGFFASMLDSHPPYHSTLVILLQDNPAPPSQHPLHPDQPARKAPDQRQNLRTKQERQGRRIGSKVALSTIAVALSTIFTERVCVILPLCDTLLLP